LTDDEREVLRWMLADPSIPSGDALRAQIPGTRVVGGLPTFLDLSVSGLPPAAVPDGKLPVDAVVESHSGEVTGFVLVWVKDGYLAGLEHAWVTDEMPSAFPGADRLRLWDPKSNRVWDPRSNEGRTQA
jgi:hypothetical protein